VQDTSEQFEIIIINGIKCVTYNKVDQTQQLQNALKLERLSLQLTLFAGFETFKHSRWILVMWLEWIALE
jgi:hypothetical protein